MQAQPGALAIPEQVHNNSASSRTIFCAASLPGGVSGRLLSTEHEHSALWHPTRHLLQKMKLQTIHVAESLTTFLLMAKSQARLGLKLRPRLVIRDVRIRYSDCTHISMLDKAS